MAIKVFLTWVAGLIALTWIGLFCIDLQWFERLFPSKFNFALLASAFLVGGWLILANYLKESVYLYEGGYWELPFGSLMMFIGTSALIMYDELDQRKNHEKD
jgi:hypothetical protein